MVLGEDLAKAMKAEVTQQPQVRSLQGEEQAVPPCCWREAEAATLDHEREAECGMVGHTTGAPRPRRGPSPR